ncbi:9732_t:CDS:2 [Gigaspora margarita]|uniref:9732_t:CDS:1 n=1 Tax=Gigaspora margarita TaxID=4874 RepID=A0ABN7U988_GIGMA|nr:9732_t:CDS:2 [Gigaspora margarita]
MDDKINPKIQSVVLKDLPIYRAAFNSNRTEIISARWKKYFYSFNIEAGSIDKSNGIYGFQDKLLEIFHLSFDAEVYQWDVNTRKYDLVNLSLRRYQYRKMVNYEFDDKRSNMKFNHDSQILGAEQAAVLVNDKIYFYGGDSGNITLSDFFYLDVSTSFIITSMPWFNNIPTMGLHRTASTACTCGEDKNRIVYIGGADIVGDKFTTIFDIKSQQWSTPKTAKNFTTNRRLIQCVVSNNDIYVYGGFTGNNINDMIKLGTLNLNWTEFSPGPVAPTGVQSYSATLLNNTSILYIGGRQGGDEQTIPYSLFDKTISGDIPPLRYDHGAVFIPQYNQILILYGFPISNIPIMALDTVNFEWSIPTIKNVGGPTIGLSRFTSILIGTYIFIAFGSFILIIRKYGYPLSAPNEVSSVEPNNEVYI